MDIRGSERSTGRRRTRCHGRWRTTRPTTTSLPRAASAQAGRPLRASPGLRLARRSTARRSARRPAGSGSTTTAATRRRRRVAAPARLGRPQLVARDRRRAPRPPVGGRAVRRDVVRQDRGDGPDAAELLEWVCDNHVARGVGDVTYTQALNPRGGIESDFTVTRLARGRVPGGHRDGVRHRTTSPGCAGRPGSRPAAGRVAT